LHNKSYRDTRDTATSVAGPKRTPAPDACWPPAPPHGRHSCPQPRACADRANRSPPSRPGPARGCGTGAGGEARKVRVCRGRRGDGALLCRLLRDCADSSRVQGAGPGTAGAAPPRCAARPPAATAAQPPRGRHSCSLPRAGGMGGWGGWDGWERCSHGWSSTHLP